MTSRDNESLRVPSPEMLDRVAREVALMSGSGAHGWKTRIDVKKPNPPLNSKRGSLIVEAEQLLRAVSNPESQVGRIPPQPPTFRAKVGAALVRLVARALFWYTPQINEINIRIAETLREHAERITEITDAVVAWRTAESQLRVEIETLRKQPETWRTAEAQLRVEIETLRKEPETWRTAEAQLRAEIDRLCREFQAQWASEAQLRAELNHRTNELVGLQKSTDLYSRQTRVMLSSQQSRLAIATERLSRNGPNNQETPRTGGGTITGLDLGPLYLEFENVFRGSRGEIKERVSVYLKSLHENRIGTSHTPVLDLGCGRGEWLEVLAENELVAQGVESHSSFVDECRARGLTVHHADALQFLRNALDESVGGVTAFHLIEHLPFPTILELLDEACRVLKPGGLLIIEMPNPANLLVGAHTFYLDPSHIRPLPADLMRFMVESRGFTRVEVVPLHPFPESYRLDEKDNRAAAVLNQFLFGPQDYAVIGRRP